MKPLIELFIASTFWGFGFTATIWALESLNFVALTFYRFLGAFLFGLLAWGLTKPKWNDLKFDFKKARSAGFWLGLTLILQTWGLMTTTATKSAFITVLYAVFVPVLAAVFDRETLSRHHLLCLITALIGTSMIIQIDPTDLNLGDILTLANALTAAVQIRVMGQLAPKVKSHYNFNLFQCLWTAILCLPIVIFSLIQPQIFSGGWDLFSLEPKGYLSVISLTLGSSLFAFYLQVRAQDKVPASVAALLFLMESPMSAFFAAWLLKERLSSMQLLGALFIFSACWAASIKIQPKSQQKRL